MPPQSVHQQMPAKQAKSRATSRFVTVGSVSTTECKFNAIAVILHVCQLA